MTISSAKGPPLNGCGGGGGSNLADLAPGRGREEEGESLWVGDEVLWRSWESEERRHLSGRKREKKKKKDVERGRAWRRRRAQKLVS